MHPRSARAGLARRGPRLLRLWVGIAPVLYLACRSAPNLSDVGPPPAQGEVPVVSSNPEPYVPPRDDSPLQTDRLVYWLEGRAKEAWAIVTYTNRRSTPVYFPSGCREGGKPEYRIWRAEEDPGESVLGTEWACVGGQPFFEVAPGAVRRDSVHILVGRYPSTPADWEGLYRIWYKVYERPGDERQENLVPQRERRSNVFRVRYIEPK